MGQPGPLGPSRRFLQKAVASGGSNPARLGELGGKLLPQFSINRGRSEVKKGLHALTFRGPHILTFRGLHALAIRGLHVLTFRGLHALAIRGLHALTLRGLHALAIRGLHVLTFVGLHALTFRGLHVLANRGLHALTLRGLHALAIRGLHVLTFVGLHALTFRGLHVLANRGLHALTLRGLHALAIRGLHVLTFVRLHALTFRGLHVLANRGLHALSLRGLHVLANRGLHALTLRGLHALTSRGLHTLALRGLHALTFVGLRVLIFSVLHIRTLREFKGSHPQDTQWTRKSPTGPWGFQLWLRASISPTGCPYPPGKGSRLRDTQWTRRSPTGSWSCQALIMGLCQFYGVPVTSSKGIKPPTNRAFIKKYCVSRQAQGKTPQQPGDGRQRATDAPPSPLEFTSAHPQKGLSIAYTTWPTNRRPSPKPKVSKVLGAKASLLSTTPLFVTMTQGLVARGDTLRLSAPHHSVTPSVIDEQRPMWSSAPFPEMSASSGGDFFKSHKLSRTTSKSLTFVSCPTISVILTLRSCDMRRQIMVIPHPFCHSDTIMLDGTQRQIMVILPLLSSRGGGPDDMRRQIMVIPHTFCHSDTVVFDGAQRQIMAAGPMTCGDKLWSFRTPFVIQTQSCPMARRDKLWSFRTPFAIQTQSCPMARRYKLWSFCTLLSSRGGGPDDMRRQIMVISHTFCHSDTVVSDGTQRQIMAAGPMTCGDKLWSFRTPFAIQTQSCPMARRDKLWSFCTLLSSIGGRPDDLRRQIMVIPHTFCHSDTVVSDGTQRQLWSFCALLSSRGGGPDDMRRQIMVIPHPFCHSDTVVSDGTQRQIMVILHPSLIVADKPVDTRRFTSSSALTRSKAVASGGSNPARLGELGGKLLPQFSINRGRSEKIHAEALPKRFREEFREGFDRSSTLFIVLRSSTVYKSKGEAKDIELRYRPSSVSLENKTGDSTVLKIGNSAKVVIKQDMKGRRHKYGFNNNKREKAEKKRVIMGSPPASTPPPPPSPPTSDASASPFSVKRTRKASRLRSLSTRPPDAERPVVHVDPATGKADGPHRKKLRTYLGIVARDKVDITYKNWKEVPTAQKDLIWEDIQAEFDIPKAYIQGQKRKYF
ncbi:Dynein heavy chain [Glycine soja]